MEGIVYHFEGDRIKHKLYGWGTVVKDSKGHQYVDVIFDTNANIQFIEIVNAYSVEKQEVGQVDDQLRDFLDDLQELYKKHGVMILDKSCGCCGNSYFENNDSKNLGEIRDLPRQYISLFYNDIGGY